LAASADRSATGTGGSTVAGALALSAEGAFAAALRAGGAMMSPPPPNMRTAEAADAMCSGRVPQQPPTIRTPSLKSLARRARPQRPAPGSLARSGGGG
jgi:hypothetical protein